MTDDELQRRLAETRQELFNLRFQHATGALDNTAALTRVKHRKQHRGRRAGLSRGQTRVQFGEYGLKSLDAGWLTNRQIEAARIAMTRKIKRGGKVWITIFPDKSVTQKPAETRMGSGKGSPEHWVAVVKPGRVMFELAGVPEPLAREALRLAGQKLSVKTKVVKREAELFD